MIFSPMIPIFVIGQESAKITLAVSIYNHYKRILYHNRHMSNDGIEIQKSNILMIGDLCVHLNTVLLRMLSTAFWWNIYNASFYNFQ